MDVQHIVLMYRGVWEPWICKLKVSILDLWGLYSDSRIKRGISYTPIGTRESIVKVISVDQWHIHTCCRVFGTATFITYSIYMLLPVLTTLVLACGARTWISRMRSNRSTKWATAVQLVSEVSSYTAKLKTQKENWGTLCIVLSNDSPLAELSNCAVKLLTFLHLNADFKSVTHCWRGWFYAGQTRPSSLVQKEKER